MLVPCLALLEEDRDRALFLEVYQAHSQLLLRVAGRVLGGDRMLAEEAAQEAWIKVCTHFESFLSVPCHKRRAWLVIVVENAAKDLLRKEKRRSAAPLSFDPPDRSADPARGEGWLLDAIDAMPPQAREVLTLRLVMGCSDQETARILGVPRGTAAQRYSRARARLADYLKKEGLVYE